jgi:hypothetical protein
VEAKFGELFSYVFPDFFSLLLPPPILQYGTKALDKITKAILGHIENKVPPPKGYPGGEAQFFRGTLPSPSPHKTSPPGSTDTA